MGCLTVKNQMQQTPLLYCFPHTVSFPNICIMKSSFPMLFPQSIWMSELALLPNGCQETELKRFQDLSPPTTFILLNYLN